MADYDDISLIEKGEMSSFNILQRVSHILFSSMGHPSHLRQCFLTKS